MILYRYTESKVERLARNLGGEDALRAARLIRLPSVEGDVVLRYRYADCPEDAEGYPYGPEDVEPV